MRRAFAGKLFAGLRLDPFSADEHRVLVWLFREHKRLAFGVWRLAFRVWRLASAFVPPERDYGATGFRVSSYFFKNFATPC
jgi:hypothetical protein